MRLVDDQQPEPAGQPVEHPPTEARVGQPLRRYQQDVDLIGTQGRLDLGPGVDVGGVQRRRTKTGPTRGDDLVAHQRQQR